MGVEIDLQTIEGQLSIAALLMAAGTANTAAALQQNIKASDLVDARKADETEANRLANHDIAKAIGKTIGTIIKDVIRQPQPQWDQLTAAPEAAWVAIAETAPLDQLGMLHDAAILEAIKNDPDKPEFEATNDKAFWQDILVLMATRVKVDAAALAATTEFAAVVNALDSRFCYEFYQVLKQDATVGGRAYPGIMLRCMGRALVYLERIDKRQERDSARLDRLTQLLRDVIDKLAEKSSGDYLVFQRLHLSLQAGHAPNLTLPTLRAANASTATTPDPDRFVYKSERMTVVGREYELNELSQWLDLPAAFGWDLWVGPAGSGKSRLALQLCRERTDWYGGFFSFKDTHKTDWTLWQPKANTLIIFDYVAEKAEAIGTIISTLTRRATPGQPNPLHQGIKVRCLLLERAALQSSADAQPTSTAREPGKAATSRIEAPWLSPLRVAAKSSGATVEIVYARQDMQSQGRYIGGVSPQAAMDIVWQEAQIAGVTPTKDQFTQRLASVARIDPHLRPLFVAMAAEAHRVNKDVADFNQLVKYIQENEWLHALKRLHDYSGGQAQPMKPGRNSSVSPRCARDLKIIRTSPMKAHSPTRSHFQRP